MARLNGILKFTLINVNILFSVIGLFILALGVYLLAGNFGKLDPGFFLGTGLIIVFCGTTIVVGSCLGCQGAINQTEKFGTMYYALEFILTFSFVFR